MTNDPDITGLLQAYKDAGSPAGPVLCVLVPWGTFGGKNMHWYFGDDVVKVIEGAVSVMAVVTDSDYWTPRPVAWQPPWGVG